MNHHPGQLKSINGIEYNIHNIPEGVILYPNWLDNINSEHPSILECISSEIVYTLNTDTQNKYICTYSNAFNISSTQGMPPIQLKDSYVYRAFYNWGQPGVFNIKDIHTQKKWSFIVDTKMLLILHDPTHRYVVGCPYSDQNRTVFSFSFKNI